MKTLFTSEVSSKGGRSGSLSNPDGLLNVTLGNPLKPGEENRGPNPELLFAGAYAACYHSALTGAAKKLNVSLKDSTVRALSHPALDAGSILFSGSPSGSCRTRMT